MTISPSRATGAVRQNPAYTTFSGVFLSPASLVPSGTDFVPPRPPPPTYRDAREERAMTTPFEVTIHARWPDMDQNGHMRTVAYLEVAEDSRMQYFASREYSMGSFVKHRRALARAPVTRPTPVRP
jgi:hypothetical protein